MKLLKRVEISDQYGFSRRFFRFLFILFFLIVSFPPESNADDYSGDISHNCRIDLEDVILVLQVLSGTAPGLSIYSDADINGDDAVDINDAILCFKAIVGLDVSEVRNDYEESETDVNGDQKIGSEEAIYILKKVAKVW
jgi:hypothetical protein